MFQGVFLILESQVRFLPGAPAYSGFAIIRKSFFIVETGDNLELFREKGNRGQLLKAGIICHRHYFGLVSYPYA